MEKELLRPLTSLRFYAAFLVFVVHVLMLPGLEPYAHPTMALPGMIGVSVFFVLSGFIMCHVYYGMDAWPATRAASAGFIVARITRIFPLHWLTLVLALPLALSSATARLEPADLPVHALLLTLFSPVHSFSPQPNKVAWTLSCELLFYLLTPLLFLLMKRSGARRPVMLGALFAVTVTAAYALFRVPGVNVGAAPFRLADYLLGLLAFLVFREKRAVWSGRMNWMLPAGAAWFAAAFIAYPHLGEGLPVTPLLLPGSVLIVLGTAFLHRTHSWFLASDAMVRLGEASFALYMLHELCLRYGRRVLVELGMEIPAWLAVPAGLLAFAAIQWLSVMVHKRFEMPAQRAGRRRLFRLLRIGKAGQPAVVSA